MVGQASVSESTLTGVLAEFVTDAKFSDLPAPAVDNAKVIIASTIASAGMGKDIGSAGAFREMAKERGGTAEASIWFDAGPKLPVMDVARTNALMSDASASDDTDLRGAGHLGTVTSTAALAMGERVGATGQDVLAAIVLGYDVAGRIGEHVHSGEIGFHAGVQTIFGATVAAGKLMKLSQFEMMHALSLAATSIGGIGIAANTSWVREYDAGLASTLAITAVEAAHHGFTSETRVLEMPRGYLETFHGYDTEAITANLGKTWHIIENLAVKLMPGGWGNHALVEAAINATTEGGIKPDQVDAITVSDRPYGDGHLLFHPIDLIGVAHSLPYMLAAAVVDHEYTWGHAEPAKFMDPVIGRLQEKVRLINTPPMQPHLGGGTVTITTTDGRSFSSTVVAPLGSGLRGIKWADIDGKYRSLVPLSGLPAARIASSLDVIHRFEQAKAVSELTSLLHS